MILIALAVIAATATGQAAARRHRARAHVAARLALGLMLYVLVPFVAFVNIAHLHITAAVGAGLGLAYAVLALVGSLAWLVGRRMLRLSPPATGALVCATILANTGYLGLPIAVALLGTSKLATAVAYDQLVSGPLLMTAGFGIGAAVGTRAGTGARERLRSFVQRNPPLLAVLAGLLAPASAAPHALLGASHGVVLALLPLGFFAVGVNLTTEEPVGRRRLLPALGRPALAAVLLRMVLAPLLLLALSSALVSIPRAYLVQSAMPSGINGLVVGHAYGLDVGLISAAVAWTTVIALVAGVAVSLA